jgi:integrase
LPKYKADVEDSTYASHKRMIMLSVDRFDNHILDQISVRDCEEYRTWLMSDSGFSRDYANVCYVAFRQTLGYAEHLGLITTNVAMKTKAIPKGKAVAKYWTKAEFEKVLGKISIKGFYEHCIYVMLLFYYRTGVRVSEGFALTWNDIDLVNQKARIFHTIYYKNKDDYQIKPYTKTKAGKRIITLDDELVQILKDWRQIQLDHGVKKFVLSYDDRLMIKSTLNNVLHKYAKLAGVPGINGRGLRHSHASYLIAELGADVLTVSKRLGHSSPAVTLRYYAHMFDRNDELIADKMVGSMDLTPAKHSQVKFNGNQIIPFSKVV